MCFGIIKINKGSTLSKAVSKAEEMLEEAEALQHNFVPIGRDGQRLLFFLDQVKKHYNQVICFYDYNS